MEYDRRFWKIWEGWVVAAKCLIAVACEFLQDYRGGRPSLGGILAVSGGIASRDNAAEWSPAPKGRIGTGVLLRPIWNQYWVRWRRLVGDIYLVFRQASLTRLKLGLRLTLSSQPCLFEQVLSASCSASSLCFPSTGFPSRAKTFASPALLRAETWQAFDRKQFWS